MKLRQLDAVIGELANKLRALDDQKESALFVIKAIAAGDNHNLALVPFRK